MNAKWTWNTECIWKYEISRFPAAKQLNWKVHTSERFKMSPRMLFNNRIYRRKHMKQICKKAE